MTKIVHLSQHLNGLGFHYRPHLVLRGGVKPTVYGDLVTLMQEIISESSLSEGGNLHADHIGIHTFRAQ